MAGLGLVQYERYPKLLAQRKSYIERYDKAFEQFNANSKGVKIMGLKHYTEYYASSGHLYICRLLGMNREQVNGVIEKMAEHGVATNVHYMPLPMMTPTRRWVSTSRISQMPSLPSTKRSPFH